MRTNFDSCFEIRLLVRGLFFVSVLVLSNEGAASA
jgi:hypothetical protein